MIIFSLTEFALEATLAVTWWTCKKTYYATSYTLKYLYNLYNNYYDENSNQPCHKILMIKNCSCIEMCNCH